MQTMRWRRESRDRRRGWQRQGRVAAGVLLALTTCGCAAKEPEGPPPWAAAAQQANAAASHAAAGANRAEVAATRAEDAANRVEAAATRVEEKVAQMETQGMSRRRQ